MEKRPNSGRFFVGRRGFEGRSSLICGKTVWPYCFSGRATFQQKSIRDHIPPSPQLIAKWCPGEGPFAYPHTKISRVRICHTKEYLTANVHFYDIWSSTLKKEPRKGLFLGSIQRCRSRHRANANWVDAPHAVILPWCTASHLRRARWKRT